MGDVNQDFAKASVLSVLKAVSLKDRGLLNKAAAGFNRDSLDMLQIWIYEAITGKWDQFSEEESYGLIKDPNFARRLLLCYNPDIRPRLLVKTMFDGIL